MSGVKARSDETQAARLLQAGRLLTVGLDPDAILERLLEIARELTGARYAAIEVLAGDRDAPEQLVTSGAPPRGNGALDAPLTIGGEPWGTLHVADKTDGTFNDAEREAVAVLADWAAIAIDHARLYRSSAEHSAALGRAVEEFEATTAIARAVGSETDLARVLELIVTRGQALVRARTVVLLLEDRGRLVAASGAGQVGEGTLRAVLSTDSSVAGEVLQRGRSERIPEVAVRFGVADEPLDVPGAETAMLMPLTYRGRSLGVLCAFDRLDEDPEFGDRDEELLLSFATSAATAVATARSVEADRLHHSLRSAERERTRWARELHDETLQGLGALQVLLRLGLRQGGDALERAATQAAEQVSTEIANLRALITELRPAALDQLGLNAALEGLGRRSGEVDGLLVTVRMEGTEVLDADLRTAIYRLVQEALTNVGKHALAGRVDIVVDRSAEGVRVRVADDGAGFDRAAPTEGFGLAGMQERAALMGGHLTVTTSGEGTTVLAVFPLPERRS